MAGVLLRALGSAVALESVDVTGMYIGQIFVDDAAAAWQLTVSTAALDATHKAVLGVTGLRWVAYSGGGGGAPSDAAYWTKTANGSLSAEVAMDALSGLPGLIYVAADGTPTKATAAQASKATLVSRTTVGAEASSVSISGLDGDADVIYDIDIEAIGGSDSSAGSGVLWKPNAGTTNLYSTGYVATTATAAGVPQAQGSQTLAVIGNASEAGGTWYLKGSIYAKTGKKRAFVVAAFGTFSTTQNSRYSGQGVAWWNETATNLTSFDLASTGVKIFGAGSIINVWKRTPI
jgi:hypothetical protein